jgi:hypothetical protein
MKEFVRRWAVLSGTVATFLLAELFHGAEGPQQPTGFACAPDTLGGQQTLMCWHKLPSVSYPVQLSVRAPVRPVSAWHGALVHASSVDTLVVHSTTRDSLTWELQITPVLWSGGPSTVWPAWDSLMVRVATVGVVAPLQLGKWTIIGGGGVDSDENAADRRRWNRLRLALIVFAVLGLLLAATDPLGGERVTAIDCADRMIKSLDVSRDVKKSLREVVVYAAAPNILNSKVSPKKIKFYTEFPRGIESFRTQWKAVVGDVDTYFQRLDAALTAMRQPPAPAPAQPAAVPTPAAPPNAAG